MSDPLDWLDAELADLDAQGLRRQLRSRTSPLAATIECDGRTLVNFGSNDYLGLGRDLGDAARRAIDQFGWGSGASPVVTGRTEPHQLLERAIAEFERTEAALLFSSGYAANVGTIPAIVGRGDVVFSDAKNHASIIDGCRLSRGRIEIYPHADVDALEVAVAAAADQRRRLIVTESVFSMDGDFAPLDEIVQVAQKHGAMLLVDEAHATGVFGDQGRGLCEMLGIQDHVPIRVGTLSKALGSVGGFVTGKASLIEWLAHKARTYFFSTSPPTACATAGLEALRVVRREPHRREDLLSLAQKLRASLERQGWNIGRSQSHIIPLVIGDARRTMALAARLLDHGLLVPGIRPPSVPAGESLLRVSLCYGHTEAMTDRLLAALAAE